MLLSESLLDFIILDNEEWPHVIRWYDIFNGGELDVDRTLHEINKHSNVTFRKLPEGSLN